MILSTASGDGAEKQPDSLLSIPAKCHWAVWSSFPKDGGIGEHERCGGAHGGHSAIFSRDR